MNKKKRNLAILVTTVGVGTVKPFEYAQANGDNRIGACGLQGREKRPFSLVLFSLFSFVTHADSGCQLALPAHFISDGSDAGDARHRRYWPPPAGSISTPPTSSTRCRRLFIKSSIPRSRCLLPLFKISFLLFFLFLFVRFFIGFIIH